jgi:hypothetical protein
VKESHPVTDIERCALCGGDVGADGVWVRVAEPPRFNGSHVCRACLTSRCSGCGREDFGVVEILPEDRVVDYLNVEALTADDRGDHLCVDCAPPELLLKMMAYTQATIGAGLTSSAAGLPGSDEFEMRESLVHLLVEHEASPE